MSSAMDFISALRASKEAQEKYKKFSIESRADILRRFAELIYELKEELVKNESIESGLPESFCFEEIVDAAQKFIENLSLEVRLFSRPEYLSPTGIIGISGPRKMKFLYQAQWIANCLAAGNGVILKTDSGKGLREILKKLDFPQGLIQIIEGADGELNPIIAGHPGLAGFIYSGAFAPSGSLIEEVAKRKKKAQFFLGAKNSALIHPDFDFKKNIKKILQPALVGMGQLDINTHRFFITQNIEKEFYETLQNYFRENPIQSNFYSEGFQQATARVVSEEGKILVSGIPTFTRDLPNCSDLQQDQIFGPLFIVTSVKYVHEMVKWTNTGYFGHSAIVWGPEDKAQGLAVQLNVGQVLINRWSRFSDWAIPVKQSFWGIADTKWSGSFYSDVKKVMF